jgi:hypothetical protein
MYNLTRIIHEASTVAADPGMSTAFAWFLCARSIGLLDVLSSTPAVPSVARLVSTPVYTVSVASLTRTLMNNPG